MLYNHQIEFLKLDVLKTGLFWETGTGKTIAAIEWAKKNNDAVLIISPKSLKENWKREIGDAIKHVIYSKEEFRKHHGVIGFYNTVIVDEAHYFSGLKSQMSKNLLVYVKKHSPKNILLLTATPYMSTPWNVFILAKILGKNWSWTKFKHCFFVDVRMGGRIIPHIKPNMEKEVAAIVKSIGYTKKLSDCIDLPNSIYQQEFFELTKEQKKAIEGLDDDSHIARWTKTHQICGGTLKNDGYTKDSFFKNEKLNRLLDIVQFHKKLAVICRYNNEISHINSLIKDKKVFIIQGVIKDKQSVVNAINNTDECIVLINAACSEGYNMPSVPLMVFYSYDFSLKNYVQIKGRIQRINSPQKCVYLSLTIKDSVDEDVYKSVVVKKQDFHLELYKNGYEKEKT